MSSISKFDRDLNQIGIDLNRFRKIPINSLSQKLNHSNSSYRKVAAPQNPKMGDNIESFRSRRLTKKPSNQGKIVFLRNKFLFD